MNQRTKPIRLTFVCDACGQVCIVTSKRGRFAHYCGPACRQRACRARKKGDQEAARALAEAVYRIVTDPRGQIDDPPKLLS